MGGHTAPSGVGVQGQGEWSPFPWREGKVIVSTEKDRLHVRGLCLTGVLKTGLEAFKTAGRFAVSWPASPRARFHVRSKHPRPAVLAAAEARRASPPAPLYH